MGIDNPDDAEMPPERHSDQRADRTPAPEPSGKVPPETRFREEYDAELHAAAEAQKRTKPAGPAEQEQQAKTSASWEETVELGRWMWSEYKRRWPPEERPSADRSNSVLTSAQNAELEEECDSIADREEKIVSPRMREVESHDPHRHLVGFDDRLKGRDRIEEKVRDSIGLKHHTPKEAISLLSDTIRFTFQYDEARYTQGVWADIVRLKEEGFKLDKRKNFWSGDQYKGINSQWIEPDTGQRFEVQFHTRISFEAKQLTHPAYERLRTKQADAFEELVLEAFQKKFTAEVPVPLGAAEIPDYPERGRDVR